MSTGSIKKPPFAGINIDHTYPNTWTTTVSQNAVVTTAQAVAMVIWFDANAWPVLNCVAIR